ncbi:hypothetical protein ACSBR1_012904 [Camellia fascicularis]
MIHTVGTWPYVDSLYQRNVRNYSHCHLHQHYNKMRIQTTQVDLTGNFNGDWGIKLKIFLLALVQRCGSFVINCSMKMLFIAKNGSLVY